MSIVELLFVASLLVPPSAVILGAILLAMPARHEASEAAATHAHAH